MPEPVRVPASPVRRAPLSDMGCAGVLLLGAAVSVVLLIILTPPRPRGELEAGVGLSAQRSKTLAKRKPSVPKPPKPKWRDAAKTARAAVDKVKWKVVFRDDFERQGLGKNWTVHAGKDWAVEGGRLHCKSAGESANSILCTATTFNGTFRIRYQAQASAEQKKPVDLSLMTHLPATGGFSPNSGYIFQVGGWNNSFVGLADTHHHMGFAVNKEMHIVPGKVHEVEIAVVGKHIVMTFDGEIAVAGIIDPPLASKDRSRGGFYVWTGPSWFDNLVVEKPQGTR